MHAQTVEAANWWAKSRGRDNASWIANYQNSLKGRQRTAIVEIVKGLSGVTSVLEVGCHCGPNLIRLAQELPGIEQLTGVEINADAVKAGQRWVEHEGLQDRVSIVEGRVPDKTDILPSECVDVVLSCYALAYIAPTDLDAVLYDVGRLAKRAVILAEPMPGSTPRAASLTDYQEWVHDYQAASKWIPTWRGMTQTIVPVTPPIDRLQGILVAVRGES
jgi:predicted O-methyltransferase YrrM